ncbi:MAG: DUF805 domain-containing protein [Opitutaceae bacterium]
MIHSFLSSEGRVGRFAYILSLVILSAIVYGVWLWASNFFSHWHHGTFGTLAVFLTIVAGLLAIFIGLMQMLKRLRDMGKAAYFTLLMFVPGVNVLFLLYTFVAPAKSE